MIEVILRIETIWIFGLCIDYLTIDLHRVLVLEGREASKHFINQDAQGPPVYWLSMSLIKKNLWSNVFWCATDSEGSLGNNFSEAEIY